MFEEFAAQSEEEPWMSLLTSAAVRGKDVCGMF